MWDSRGWGRNDDGDGRTVLGKKLCGVREMKATKRGKRGTVARDRAGLAHSRYGIVHRGSCARLSKREAVSVAQFPGFGPAPIICPRSSMVHHDSSVKRDVADGRRLVRIIITPRIDSPSLFRSTLAVVSGNRMGTPLRRPCSARSLNVHCQSLPGRRGSVQYSTVFSDSDRDKRTAV